MRFQKLCNGRALYAEENQLWVAQGRTFFALDAQGNRVTPKYKTGSLFQRIIASFRIPRQLLREGYHHLLPLVNGNVFVTAKRQAMIIDKDGKIEHIFNSFSGNKPGHQGVCLTPDGALFFAEYTVNLDHKNETRLFRSTDNGASFQCVLTFPRNVRHIHFVKYDPYERCLWLGTGDANDECFLMKSTDNGNTWETVGGGSQDWRAIGICLTKDALIWGTDAGSVPDQNHLVRLDRKTRSLSILADAEGPCHCCAVFHDGRVMLSTGVEGGENERDRYARLKTVEQGKVIDLFQMKKDFLPEIVHYGVMRFPLGAENTRHVVFTCYGLGGHGEVVVYEA